MTTIPFYLGIDDTDAPEGMCTTWLGALLIRILQKTGMKILYARLVRLNPTIPYKTRGNAAISLKVLGDPEYALSVAEDLVSAYAELSCDNTHPGIVVSANTLPADFYWKAVTGTCFIEEAKQIIHYSGLDFREYKMGRGLIGALAAICSEFPDYTWEYLAYRNPDRFLRSREYDPLSFSLSESLTWPHTWDTWDPDSQHPVCIPHGSDPVLYGIRGDSPFSVSHAVSSLISEPAMIFQIWMTNQGTDAHLVTGSGENLVEGMSYLVPGTVHEDPVTGEGGHVSFMLRTGDLEITCMAFEPTKKFRDSVRALCKGDEILVAGSFIRNTLNMEKFYLYSAKPVAVFVAPFCPSCGKRMTSAGSGKGYKCRRCGNRERKPDPVLDKRIISPGWYEVPPGSRRHLARPLARGEVIPDSGYLPISRRRGIPDF